MEFSEEMIEKIRAGADHLEVSDDAFVELAIDKMLLALGLSPQDISEDR